MMSDITMRGAPRTTEQWSGIRYDSSVLYRLAQRLDYSAWLGIVLFTLLGAGIGWSAGTTLGQPLLHGDNESVSRYQLFATIIFGAVGYWLGSERAFRLRILMHTILCQVQIEENTRAPQRRGDCARLLAADNQLCVDDPKAIATAADECSGVRGRRVEV